MKLKRDFTNLILICFIILSISIIAGVLFTYPHPGVADQGDFDRVMSVSGLEFASSNESNPSFDRFFKYIVTDYKITEASITDIVSRIPNCSMSYLITLINFICRLLGQNFFNTSYLAICYSAIYTCSLYIIIKHLNIRSRATLVFLVLLSLLVFYDGNYLVWFNSLYGEPMMMITLMLYISSWIYYIHYKYILKTEKNITSKIAFIFITAFLFLGSKMQVITALPIIIIMLSILLFVNRTVVTRRSSWVLSLLLIVITAYPLQINIRSGGINKDIHYNSVFYGVLKDSKNPRQDLIDMDLNPEMAVDAGKNSYLDKKDYVKYVPHTGITEAEFYSKIGSGKLIRFYITHPLRLIQGMQYTARHAFTTSTVLGHYEKTYSEKPIKYFNRFTIWSSLRQILFPKSLSFIVGIYISVIGLSLYIFIKNKNNSVVRAKLGILWSIMFIGLLQFPMPFIGNGEADTTKQLFLFNFVFDIIFVVLVSWLFFKFEEVLRVIAAKILK